MILSVRAVIGSCGASGGAAPAALSTRALVDLRAEVEGAKQQQARAAAGSC
jgi:hypothetical protein